MNVLLSADSFLFLLSNDCYYSFIIKVIREQGQALSQYISNFCCGAADKSVKTAGNYFQQQNISQSTVYYILKIYLLYETTKDLCRSNPPVKLSMKDLNALVKSINNRCARSQRKLGQRFRVHHSTISCSLQQRTSIVIRKRKKSSKNGFRRTTETSMKKLWQTLSTIVK